MIETLSAGTLRRRALNSTAFAGAFLLAGTGAFAQTAAGSPPPAASAAQGPSQQGAQIQEIIVTAERRETTVQRTPATIEVVGAATLDRQRIVNFSDLNSVLNDTQIVPIGIATQVVIRGIGNNFVDPRADPAVATSVNGLFYARPLPLGFAFLDVARVENLEGPQGTLYGRGAAAGALNIITNQPVNKWAGSLEVSGGNLGENQVTAVINVPVADNLAIRAAYDRNRRDGYLDSYYDDVHSDTARLSARWTPTDKLTVYVESNYDHVGGHGNTPEPYPCAGSSPYSSFTPAACNALGPFNAKASLTGQIDSYVQSDLLHLDYDLGGATISSISGYVDTHQGNNLLANGSYFTNTESSTDHDYSEELRLAGHGSATHRGGFAWQVGTYLFDSDGHYYINTQAATNRPPTNTQIFSKIPQSSEAGYAQATYGLTDKLRLTGGVRYTHDNRGITASSSVFLPPTFTVAAPFVPVKAKSSDGKFTYKGGVEYDLAAGHLLYATVSTGYASSGVNGGNPSATLTPTVAPAAFKPETITAYEIGSKNRFFGGRLIVNGDFYYYQFHNYQYLFSSYVQGGTGQGLNIQDIASVKAYGAEANAQFALTSNDRLSGSVSWSHGTFGSIQFAGFTPPAKATLTTLPSGSPIPNDPHWSALLGYEHTFPIDQSTSLVFGVNSKISSKYLLVVASSLPADYQKAYTMTDISLALRLHEDKYEARLWVKNVENSLVNVYGEGLGFNLYGVAPPRTYGVTLSAKF